MLINLIHFFCKEKTKNNNLGYNLNYNASNRYYESNNNFKLLNYGTGVQNFISRGKENGEFKNTTSNYDVLSKQNEINLNANLQLGFGKGRLEYVTDPIMAAFMLIDLQDKAGIGTLTNEQVENIGKGITAIRNTRFIDFRFRLIDQLEMLDSVLQANGVKSNKASRYFTTINDNWLYATQFGRFTGKRWTFYLDNRAFLGNDKTEFNNKLIIGNHFKGRGFNRNIYNGFGINFDKSKQKSIYRQNTWGFNVNAGLQHNTNGTITEDSIGKSSFLKTETKNKPDAINANIGVYYEYLWQPNTRTFFTARVNPNLNTIRSQNGIRRANLNNSFNNNLNYGLATDFRYFKFFTARLSAFVNAEINVTNNRNINFIEFGITPNPILTSKNIGTNFSFNHNFSAGITYVLF